MTLARIGRFQVERPLGSGTFATVWLARDEDLDAWVAIKLLAENWSMNEDARRRFIEEARALRRLDSDRIVRVYEFGHLEDGRPYMVMEFADRGTLEDRMRLRAQLHQTFPVEEAVALAAEISECLVSVHAYRLVHRDVKPSNVLFRRVPEEHRAAMERSGLAVRGERTLLGDFGIARRLEGILGHTMVVGSPQYMAPEQGDPARAGRADFRSDIYSAAVILYEMLAGRLPFGFDSATEVRATGSDATPPPVAEVRPEVAPGLSDLLARGLARDPGVRVASAAQWRDELQRVRTEGVVRTPAPAEAEARPRVEVIDPIDVPLERTAPFSPPFDDPGGRGVGVPVEPHGRGSRTEPTRTRIHTRPLEETRPGAARAAPVGPMPPLPPPPGSVAMAEARPALPGAAVPPRRDGQPLTGGTSAPAALAGASAPAPPAPARPLPVRFAAFLLMASSVAALVSTAFPWTKNGRVGVVFVEGTWTVAVALLLFFLGLRMWRTARRWVAVTSAVVGALIGVAGVILAAVLAVRVRWIAPGLVVLGVAGAVTFVSGWGAVRRLGRHRQDERLAAVMSLASSRRESRPPALPTGPASER